MPKHDMHLEPCDVEIRGGVVRRSAEISGHPGRKWRSRNGKIFFDIPERWADANTGVDSHDAFLRAVMFSAMEAGGTLFVHGEVSAALLKNLEAYQQVIHGWWPHFRPVEVRADQTRGLPSANNHQEPQKAILSFSGGVDSTYTLYNHKLHLHGDEHREIAACVFVHGFDIPLSDNAYAGAFSKAKNVTDHVGVPLITVRSNIRQHMPSWGHSHGAALAAVLSLFDSHFGQGLIASTYPSADVKPSVPQSGYGSSAWSDPLLSSDTFEVIYDRDRPRVEKCAELLDFPSVWKNVRVCYDGKDLATNCGRCKKCIWLMLTMRAVGIEDFSAFQTPFKTRALARYGWDNPAAFFSGNVTYRYAEDQGRAHQEEFRLLKMLLERAAAGRRSLRERLYSKVVHLIERFG